MSDWRSGSRKLSLASFGKILETNVLLTFKITDLKRGVPVAFKTDGERFPDNPRTIKLDCGQKYQILVEIASKPERVLSFLEIDGVAICLTPNANGSFTGVWTAPTEPNLKSTRTQLLVILTGDETSFSTTWQCKLYPADNSHSTWGDTLHSIIYICTASDIGCLVVSEEQYKGDRATLRRSTSD